MSYIFRAHHTMLPCLLHFAAAEATKCCAYESGAEGGDNLSAIVIAGSLTRRQEYARAVLRCCLICHVASRIARHPGCDEAASNYADEAHPPTRSNMATSHKSHSSHELSSEDRKQMSDSEYAFPKQRKEPLSDASHVRNAIARFDQVKDVSDQDREEAFHRIKTAAKKHGVEMKETSWKELGKHPHTENTSQHKKAS